MVGLSGCGPQLHCGTYVRESRCLCLMATHLVVCSSLSTLLMSPARRMV